MTSQEQAMKKVLSKVVSETTAQELASLSGDALTQVYERVTEQMNYHQQMPEEPTAKSVVKDLYEMTLSDFPVSEVDELQDLIYNRVDLLAALLGIDLEE